MQFKYYDILSTLITGSVLLFVISLAIDYNIQDINMVILLAMAYILGYFLNALSAFFEPAYYLAMGGTPSDNLLKEPKSKELTYTGLNRVRFYEYQEAIQLLTKECGGKEVDTRRMFGIAKTYSIADDKTRVPDFSAQYAFSRVVLTLTIVSAASISPYYYDIWWAWIIVIALIYLVGRRCKERGYYYAREILLEYLNKNKRYGKDCCHESMGCGTWPCHTYPST